MCRSGLIRGRTAAALTNRQFAVMQPQMISCPERAPAAKSKAAGAPVGTGLEGDRERGLARTGANADALAAYEAALKLAPHRFNSVAGAARAAELFGDRIKAGAYYTDLLRLAEHAETQRPELAQARAYLATR